MKCSNRAASSEFGTYRLCEQRRFRRACASAQSRQNLRCSLIQALSQEEPSDRKSDPWPLWIAGHAQLKFVMTECSKTQIRLTWSNTCIFSSWTTMLYFSKIATKRHKMEYTVIFSVLHCPWSYSGDRVDYRNKYHYHVYRAWSERKVPKIYTRTYPQISHRKIYGW